MKIMANKTRMYRTVKDKGGLLRHSPASVPEWVNMKKCTGFRYVGEKR